MVLRTEIATRARAATDCPYHRARQAFDTRDTRHCRHIARSRVHLAYTYGAARDDSIGSSLRVEAP